MSAPCLDCGADTAPCTGKRGCRHRGKWEYYMVHDRLWAKAGGRSGFLCVRCLERRLGRPLTRRDFPRRPINAPDPWDTERLAQAKHRPP